MYLVSVGFAVVLGTNNVSNAELVVQGIAEYNLECYWYKYHSKPCINCGEQTSRQLASFPSSRVEEEEREPGTHCSQCGKFPW